MNLTGLDQFVLVVQNLSNKQTIHKTECVFIVAAYFAEILLNYAMKNLGINPLQMLALSQGWPT